MKMKVTSRIFVVAVLCLAAFLALANAQGHHDHHDHAHGEHDHHDHHDHAHEEHAHEEKYALPHVIGTKDAEHDHDHHDHAHDEHDHHDHAHEEHAHEHHDHAAHEHDHHEHEEHAHDHHAHEEKSAHKHEAHAHAHDAHAHTGGKCPFGHDHSAHAHDAHAHDAHGHGHNHRKAHVKREAGSADASGKAPAQAYTRSTAAAYALGATFFISIVPIGILPFIPLDATTEKRPLLNVFLSFAVGGLLGDVFLHLLPHSLNPHDHSSHGDEHGHDDHHGHDHDAHGHDEHGHDEGLTVGLYLLLGILVFFIVEKAVRARSGGGHSHAHVHAHSHGAAPKKPESDKNKSEKKEKKAEQKHDPSEVIGEVKVGGLLNLVADAAHNFTDGLALASSFQISAMVGIVTTIAVFVHEIPHEIGDFAILLQQGYTRSGAMKAQFGTGVAAMLGCVVGIAVEGFGNSIGWILPFTAGGFIYVATVNVIPELLADTGFKQSLKEVLAASLGVGLMVAVAHLEHADLL